MLEIFYLQNAVNKIGELLKEWSMRVDNVMAIASRSIGDESPSEASFSMSDFFQQNSLCIIRAPRG